MPISGIQRGVTLLAAVFILVVLAFLGVVFLSLFTISSSTSVAQLESLQSLSIAEGGLERATRFLLDPSLTTRGSCANVAPLTNIAFGRGTFTITTEAGSPFYPAAAASLAAPGIGAADTTIAVTSTAGYAPSGRTMIDREVIDYSGVTANSFTGAVRGRDGTTASAHATGTRVGQYQCSLVSAGGTPDLAAPRAKRTAREGVQLQEAWIAGAAGGVGQRPLFVRFNRPTELQWNMYNSAAINLNVQLNSISMLSYADGWAVGNAVGGNETILRWNGTAWARMGPYAAVPNVNLTSISCVNSNDCIAVGAVSGGNEVIVRWNGVAWTQMGPYAAVPNIQLNSVYCNTSNDCWAVGNNSAGETIIRWNGATWVRIGPVAAIPNTNLLSIHCVNSNDCMAVGAVSGGNEVIIRWNGAVWTRMGPYAAVPNANLNSVFCTNSNDCWAVGAVSGGETIIHWNGAAWTRMGPYAAVPDSALTSIACANSNDCWAVGNNSGGELIIHWDGTMWTRVGPSAAVPNVNLRAVAITGPHGRPQAAWQEVIP
jgi:Tfp pilus assembly protein PilX